MGVSVAPPLEPSVLGQCFPRHTTSVSEPRRRSIYRFSLDQYHRMIDHGILTTNDKLELLEGYLIAMSPIGPPHSYAVQKTTLVLGRLLPPRWEIRMQQPVTFPDSEPEPDVCVVRGSIDDYKSRHAGPGDISLLVEVAESSESFDRNYKAGLYAAQKIPQYWIINLNARQVEVYTDPRWTEGASVATYQNCTIAKEGEILQLTLDGEVIGEIRVGDLLP